MPLPSEKIVKRDRRPVQIAGPVYQEFSRICGALELNRQNVASNELARWNKRHARRAGIRLREKADALAMSQESCAAE